MVIASSRLTPDAKLLGVESLQEATRIQESGGEEACFRLTRELADLPVVAKFTVEGEPCSKARARFTNYGSKIRAYTPEKTLTAEKGVAEQFRQAAKDHTPDDNVTYGVMALFFCGVRQRRDVDNMTKLILDGLNKVAWHDDSQVVEISARKELVLPEEARSEVVIYKVGFVRHFTKSCPYCGESFNVFQARGKFSTRKFCSRGCADASRRKVHDDS